MNRNKNNILIAEALIKEMAHIRNWDFAKSAAILWALLAMGLGKITLQIYARGLISVSLGTD